MTGSARPWIFLLSVSFTLISETPMNGAEKERGFIQRTHKDAQGQSHSYTLFVPHGYDAKAEKPSPVILFLHGAGESEGGTKTPVEVGLGPAIRKYGEAEFPCFVVFPR